MAGDTNAPAESSYVNGSIDNNESATNPYETDPELIPKDDPFLARSSRYGRYAPHKDDFKPRYNHWYQSEPEATSYWEDIVRTSCTEENSLNVSGPREAFATGSVIIRVDNEPAVGAAAERYSYINANEVSAERKAEDTLRELGVAVPVIYYCGTVDEKNVTVESRIPGVSLDVAWRYLTAEQIDTIKQQCRHILQRLSDVESAPDYASYACSGLNSELPSDLQESEREVLFQDKREDENLCLVHNDMVRSNIVVKNDRVVGILGWRRSGFFGLERAKKVHCDFRPEDIPSIDENGDKEWQTWADLYDDLPEATKESEHLGAQDKSGPRVKSEPSNMPLDKFPPNGEIETKSTLAQLDGTALPEEHPTPKKIADLKNGVTSRASSADRSSPSLSAKPGSSRRKSAPGVTKKGTAKKPATKKRKLNNQDSEGVNGSRSNTPSSLRASKTPGSKKQGSVSIAGSPPPESKKRGAKDAIEEEDEEDESESDDGIFCICRKGDNHTWMIACDGGCDDWFHGKCVNIDPKDADLIEKYICPNCKNGKGATTWKPMCRLTECRKPARYKRKNPSKYCSDEHGREFMRQISQHLNLSSAKAKPAGRSSTNSKSLSRDSNSIDGEINGTHLDEEIGEEGETHPGGLENEDLGSRGGILTAGELKAVIMGVSSAEEFRKLGERIISPPLEDDESKTGTKIPSNKKLGLDIDPDCLTYSPDEASKIEELRKQRDELLHHRDMLNTRTTFLTLVRQRGKSIVERLKQTDPKGGWKDICGFDSRLAWADEEFDEWRLSDIGAKALEEGTPEALASSYPSNTDADGDTAMDEDEVATLSRGVCTKKRCERHKQWVKVHQSELLFEENVLEEDLAKCEKEAQNVVERAVLRMWAEKDNAQVGGE